MGSNQNVVLGVIRKKNKGATRSQNISCNFTVNLIFSLNYSEWNSSVIFILAKMQNNIFNLNVWFEFPRLLFNNKSPGCCLIIHITVMVSSTTASGI